jgi:type I restriction enzyme S subunit
MTSTTTHIDKKEPLVPALRFKEFGGEWSIKRVDQVLKRYSDPVKVQSETEYQQIGIRSHGKGIFHKELVTGSSLGNKRVFWIKKNLFVVNIVFAWEHAVGMTTEAENGMIASHRFPMYESVENFVDTEFIKRFFLRKRGKYLLQLASPGGAGRNKTLGQQMFNELKITFPSLPNNKRSRPSSVR